MSGGKAVLSQETKCEPQGRVTDAILTFLVATLNILFYIDLKFCVFGCAGSSLLQAGLLQLRRADWLWCVGISPQRFLLLPSTRSRRVGSGAVCPGFAALQRVGPPRHMPLPPALAGGRLATGSPGKSLSFYFILECD